MKNLRFFCSLLSTSAMLCLSVSGCYEAPGFSNTPDIGFTSITKFTVADPTLNKPNAKKDSVIITIDFRDGDGDLGETVEGRKETKYSDWGNYELKTFKKLPTGKFEEVVLAANKTIFFPELLKGSKNNNRKSPIEGLLDYSFEQKYTPSSKINVVKFTIRVRDRAMNVSNVVETDTISVPMLQ